MLVALTLLTRYSWKPTRRRIPLQSRLHALSLLSIATELSRPAHIPLFHLLKSHVSGAQKASQHRH